MTEQLDFILGMCVSALLNETDLAQAARYLDIRIKCNERDVARCRPVSEKEAEKTISEYNFNVGSALKHIFAFTRTIKKGNRPNKTELKVALRYINKEIERLKTTSEESE